ncbi:MAG: hypothetical protein AAGD38_14275 [Acidobacteriota bacterium]
MKARFLPWVLLFCVAGALHAQTPTERPATAPATSDAEILARLPAVRVVISDRQTPGQPHFLVDEASFQQAFGVGAPVKLLDVASVAIVAASELRRENIRSQEQIAALETEVNRLRFRTNMTLLLLVAVVLSTVVNRRVKKRDDDSEGESAAETSETSSETPS